MRCQQKHKLLHTNLKFSSLIHSSWKTTKEKRSLDIWLRTRTIPGTFNSSLYTNVLRGGSWGRMILKQHPRRREKRLCTEAYELSSVGSWSLAACHPWGRRKQDGKVSCLTWLWVLYVTHSRLPDFSLKPQWAWQLFLELGLVDAEKAFRVSITLSNVGS